MEQEKISFEPENFDILSSNIGMIQLFLHLVPDSSFLLFNLCYEDIFSSSKLPKFAEAINELFFSLLMGHSSLYSKHDQQFASLEILCGIFCNSSIFFSSLTLL